MTYDEQERWIRNQLCEKNASHMRIGKYPNEIFSSIEPSEENIQLDDNWTCDLYWLDGRRWSVDIFEKTTKQVFVFYIKVKEENP